MHFYELEITLGMSFMLILQVFQILAGENSRAWHCHGMGYTNAAIASVRMVTHSSTNWAHDCLTLVRYS